MYGTRFLANLRATGQVQTHVVTSNAGAFSAHDEPSLKR